MRGPAVSTTAPADCAPAAAGPDPRVAQAARADPRHETPSGLAPPAEPSPESEALRVREGLRRPAPGIPTTTQTPASVSRDAWRGAVRTWAVSACSTAAAPARVPRTLPVRSASPARSTAESRRAEARSTAPRPRAATSGAKATSRAAATTSAAGRIAPWSAPGPILVRPSRAVPPTPRWSARERTLAATAPTAVEIGVRYPAAVPGRARQAPSPTPRTPRSIAQVRIPAEA